MAHEWELVSLGDGISVKHGFAFKGEYFSDNGSEILITPGNFHDKGGFKYTPGKEKYYIHDYPSEYLCKKGDLVVAMTEQVAGLLGSTALVPENKKFLHNQRIGLITYDSAKYNNLFLYYVFRTKHVRSQIAQSSSGSKVKHTSPNRIYDVKIQIPPIKEQLKIGSLLYSIDKKIELNNKINAELEAMAKLIYDYWFVQFDFPDANGKPYKSSGGKMVYNEVLKRKIPDVWKAVSISNLLEIKTGKKDANHSTSGGKYHFFTCADKALWCDDYEFEGKSVLLAGNGNFNVKRYDGKFNAYQRTYVLIPDIPKHYSLVFYSVQNKVEQLTKGSRGSIVKFITKGDIEDIHISMRKDSNYFFYGILDTIFDKCDVLYRENLQLVELRDWLLPMLMNGQVTVNNT